MARSFSGDNEKAAADYTNAIRLDPDSDESYGLRGEAYFRLSVNFTGSGFGEERGRLTPQDVVSRDYLIKAIADLEEARRINPDRFLAERHINEAKFLLEEADIAQDSGGAMMPDTSSAEGKLQKKYDVVEDLKRDLGSSAPKSVPTPEYIANAWKGVKCRAYYLVQSYNETAFECTFPNATLQQVYPIIRPFYDYVLEPELPAKDADFEYGLDERYEENLLKTEYRYISEKHLTISNDGACLTIKIIEEKNHTMADLWRHNCD
jgi:tetratricopeptide (TPR) repeat protein